MVDQILVFLAEIFAIGGGGAVIAFLIFRYLGKSWIESKFSERLEEFKHQQAIEIQRLSVEIDSTLSGVLKIQEKEFETLTAAWGKLDEAIGQTAALISPMQSYANVDQMDKPQLEEFFENTELLETQKDKIRNSADKGNTYQDEIYWHRIHKVKVVVSNLETYIIRYGIFFPSNLKKDFDEITSQLKSAYSSYEIGKEMDDPKVQHEGWGKWKDEINPLFEKIEHAIRAQLRSHGSSYERQDEAITSDQKAQ